MENEKIDDLEVAFGVDPRAVQRFHEENGARVNGMSSVWRDYVPLGSVSVPAPVDVWEMPLQMGPWLMRKRMQYDGERRAYATATAIRHYTDAVVISLYNKKLGVSELCIERSIPRVIWKLAMFRLTRWWERVRPKKKKAKKQIVFH